MRMTASGRGPASIRKQIDAKYAGVGPPTSTPTP
ncbi:MAG: hypothetical protein HY294_11245 [Candidatus Rokubacteria bacterium]|nr:hypothetical protein [Candidatus Rokubacteria bacterium]MBI3826562.1 hypothetical protein [Candidatus Rokubacteria bacterium]